MKKRYVKLLAVLSAASMLATASACNSGTGAPPAAPSSGTGSSAASSAESSGSEEPVEITMYYSDNATLPFKEDWLAVQEVQKRFNAKINFEIIPIADYQTKVSLALNTGTNAPDVILYQSTQGENASLALNGALAPLSDYSEFTPEWNARVKEFGMEEDIKKVTLADGKRYSLPSLTDQPFYDGGLILRQDFMEKNNLAAPKTADELYQILKLYKSQNPDSYPLTVLAGPRVLYRMMMPSWGISLGKNGAGGSRVLSWDYGKNEYFTGAISDQFKEYVTFLNKLYSEGLLDPEMADPVDGDKWSQKMATGASMATYAYYDQIGGVAGASTIEGFKLNMYPPIAGPAGAHHQQKDRTGSGIIIPAKTTERPDFERVLRTVDKMFFSEEAAELWCLGVEGVSYTKDGDKIVYADEVLNSPDGVYKTMQVKYGCGSDVTQMVWVNAREMTKYDENYAKINAEVAAMDNAIQPIPPTPQFDDMKAEEAASLQSPLADTFEVWADAFVTGSKSIEKDWDAYVAEMKNQQIDKFCELYNSNVAK